MKARIRLATKTDYCFIEAEVEGTPEELVAQYGDLHRAYWNRTGLQTKQWHEVLDGYLWHNRSFTEQEFSSLSEEQAMIINTIKKSKNRAKYQVDKANKADMKIAGNIGNSTKISESKLEIIKPIRR